MFTTSPYFIISHIFLPKACSLTDSSGTTLLSGHISLSVVFVLKVSLVGHKTHSLPLSFEYLKNVTAVSSDIKCWWWQCDFASFKSSIFLLDNLSMLTFLISLSIYSFKLSFILETLSWIGFLAFGSISFNFLLWNSYYIYVKSFSFLSI